MRPAVFGLLLASAICSVASRAYAQFSNASLNMTCAFSAAGVSSPSASTPNAAGAAVGLMTFDGKGNATLSIVENFNGTVVSTGSTPLTGTYNLAPNGSGAVDFSAAGGPTFQIVIDSPSTTTSGLETEVRFLNITPSSPNQPTNVPLILVGTCKQQ